MQTDKPIMDTLVSPEMQGKITAAIEAMADSLGVAASHVYEVLVRQAYAEAVGFGVPAIFFLVLAVWCWRSRSRASASIRLKRSPEAIETAFQKYRSKYADNKYFDRNTFDRLYKREFLEPISGDQTRMEVFTFISGVLTVAGICLLAPAAMRFINPEYYAIQEVLSLLK